MVARMKGYPYICREINVFDFKVSIEIFASLPVVVIVYMFGAVIPTKVP
jgi:hypothetical protein